MEPSSKRIEQPFGSTTTRWGWTKIGQRPEGQEHRASAASTLGSLLPWPRKRPLTLKVRYRGGAECWWEIEARGRVIRRPGVVCLHDLLSALYGWPNGIPPQTSTKV